MNLLTIDPFLKNVPTWNILLLTPNNRKKLRVFFVSTVFNVDEFTGLYNTSYSPCCCSRYSRSFQGKSSSVHRLKLLICWERLQQFVWNEYTNWLWAWILTEQIKSNTCKKNPPDFIKRTPKGRTNTGCSVVGQRSKRCWHVISANPIRW